MGNINWVVELMLHPTLGGVVLCKPWFNPHLQIFQSDPMEIDQLKLPPFESDVPFPSFSTLIFLGFLNMDYIIWYLYIP